jgi:hypothetical protein
MSKPQPQFLLALQLHALVIYSFFMERRIGFARAIAAAHLPFLVVFFEHHQLLEYSAAQQLLVFSSPPAVQSQDRNAGQGQFSLSGQWQFSPSSSFFQTLFAFLKQ